VRVVFGAVVGVVVVAVVVAEGVVIWVVVLRLPEPASADFGGTWGFVGAQTSTIRWPGRFRENGGRHF